MITALKAFFLRRALVKARRENAILRAGLGIVNRWVLAGRATNLARRSRRARKMRKLDYSGVTQRPQRDTDAEISTWGKIKALGLWLVTCDVAHYRRAML